MLLANGLILVQIFFIISGFVNTKLLLSYLDENKKKNLVQIFLKTSIMRYFRFVKYISTQIFSPPKFNICCRMAPILASMILLHSTWLYRFQEGPFWNRVNESERQFCRNNWWTNLLFINNYKSGDEKVLKKSLLLL